MSASLHQSTLFAAIRLMGSDSNGAIDVLMGSLAFFFCIALPVGVVLAAAKVPRQFVDYSINPNSPFANAPLKFIAPSGTVLPSNVRFILGSVITSVVLPAPWYPAIFFASSIVTNIVALLPASSPSWLCAGSMFVSAAFHVGLAAFICLRGVYRFPTSRILNASGLLLTGVFHAQIASGWRQGIDAVLTLQASLSIFRSVVALCNNVIEWRMKKSEDVTLTKVRWSVQGGGFAPVRNADGDENVKYGDEAEEMDRDLPLLSSPPDPQIAVDDPFGEGPSVPQGAMPGSGGTPKVQPTTPAADFHPSSLGETAAVKPFDPFGQHDEGKKDILRSYAMHRLTTGQSVGLGGSAKRSEPDDFEL